MRRYLWTLDALVEHLYDVLAILTHLLEALVMHLAFLRILDALVDALCDALVLKILTRLLKHFAMHSVLFSIRSHLLTFAMHWLKRFAMMYFCRFRRAG